MSNKPGVNLDSILSMLDQELEKTAEPTFLEMVENTPNPVQNSETVTKTVEESEKTAEQIIEDLKDQGRILAQEFLNEIEKKAAYLNDIVDKLNSLEKIASTIDVPELHEETEEEKTAAAVNILTNLYKKVY